MPGLLLTLTSPEKSEEELQMDVTAMFERILLPDVAWTAIAHEHSINMTPGRNGRPIGLIEMRKRMARGVRKGIWDYWLCRAAQTYWLELKVGDNDLSKGQQEFGRQALNAGCKLKVCWTQEQALTTVVGWGLTRRLQVMA